MCDEAKLQQWAKQTLSRREFGALTGAAALTACGSGEATEGTGEAVASPGMDLTEQAVSFATQDGTMDAFFVHPANGSSPAVIMWPDIASLRESKRSMARRLAGEGYAVLVLNPYYRDFAGERFENFAAFIADDGFNLVAPWRDKLQPAAIQSDAQAAVVWLDVQDAVDTSRGIGTEGYCMGGPFTIWAAAAVPSRIKAAAAFHAGGLVRDDIALSPHKLFDQTDANFLIGIARDDDAKAPDEKDILRDAADAASANATIKVFDGDHGWTVPDSPVYVEGAADLAYADKLALYRASL